MPSNFTRSLRQNGRKWLRHFGALHLSLKLPLSFQKSQKIGTQCTEPILARAVLFVAPRVAVTENLVLFLPRRRRIPAERVYNAD